MNLKPTVTNAPNGGPNFIMSGKNLEWTVGNATIDSAEYSVGDVIPAGTAMYEDADSGLFKAVAEDTPADMKSPVLTGYDVEIQSTESNDSVQALKTGSVYEELLHGVTDNFKQATQGLFKFDY